MIENSPQLSPAAQLMTIEVVSELLVSSSPEQLGGQLTEQLRELTGAGTAMVLAHCAGPAGDELLNVSPAHRADLFSPGQLRTFCCQQSPEELPFYLEELPGEHPLKGTLLGAGIGSMIRYPLRAGGELIGSLILFDLPGLSRIAETNQIMHLLSPPIALALKNALAFRQIEQQAQELEERVEARTAELRESENRFRLAIQATRDGLWEWDIQRGQDFFSPRLCEIFGYDFDDRQLQHSFASWAERVHPDDYARVGQALDDHIEQGTTYDIDYRHRHKSGEYRWQNSRGQAFFDETGRPLKMVGCISDISDRKRAEESMVLMNFALDNIRDAAYLIDETGRFLYCNAEAARSLGYGRDELAGMGVPDIDPGYPAEIWAVHWPGLKDCGTRTLETVHRRKNGDVFPVEIFANFFEFNGTGYNLALARDITERKRGEEERAKLESQLRQSQKMESVGRLAGGVAHDFNNMLGVILGYAELALLRMDEDHPLHADLCEIRAAAERSAELTRQLLAFARKQTVAPRELDLNAAVSGMLKMLQRLIGEDIRLEWQPAVSLWAVKIDPSQIDQILANLCVNARDAMGDGGRIVIETANFSVDKDYCAAQPYVVPGDYVRLTVSDDGCGMDREALSHIFEPFYTTKEIGKGTGLGLATVYGAVKQNKGFINVYSEPGSGTTFTICLPRHRVESEEPKVPARSRQQSTARETVLLVEDEPAILNMVKMVLTLQGYTVLAANSPREALRLAGEYQGPIHLLMTDVIMPGMNGRDLAARLQSQFPQLKRLFMSGYTADVIGPCGVLDEGVSFIQKPFPIQDLTAKLREILDD